MLFVYIVCIYFVCVSRVWYTHERLLHVYVCVHVYIYKSIIDSFHLSLPVSLCIYIYILYIYYLHITINQVAICTIARLALAHHLRHVKNICCIFIVSTYLFSFLFFFIFFFCISLSFLRMLIYRSRKKYRRLA